MDIKGLYKIKEEPSRYFVSLISNNEGKEVIQCLEKNNISEVTAERLRLGYA